VQQRVTGGVGEWRINRTRNNTKNRPTIDANIISTTQTIIKKELSVDARPQHVILSVDTRPQHVISKATDTRSRQKLYWTAVVERQNGRAAEEPVVSDAGHQKFAQAHFCVGKPAG